MDSWARRNGFFWPLRLVTTGPVAAQTAQFTTSADSIDGTVTTINIPTGATQSTTISPVDQSTTSISGNNSQTAASAKQTIYHVNVYSFSAINNTTDAFDTSGKDQGDASASQGTGNLLQGLVTWQGGTTPLNCHADGTISGQLDCSSSSAITQLVINGAPVAVGMYPSGATFPVSGTINDPNCLLDGVLGTETFSGQLTLQPSTLAGGGTGQGAISISGMNLTGSALCYVLTPAVGLFETIYNLNVQDNHISSSLLGGAKVNWQSAFSSQLN